MGNGIWSNTIYQKKSHEVALGNMTDLDERFEAYVFAPKRERIVQKWRVIQCHFMAFFLINGISLFFRLLTISL